MSKPHTGGRNGGRPKKDREPTRNTALPISTHARLWNFAQARHWTVMDALDMLVNRALDDIDRRAERKIA